MAKGVNFEGANQDFRAPQGMTEEQVYTLPTRTGINTHLDTVGIESCFEFSPEEVENIKKQIEETGTVRVFLQVIGGQPPVSMSVEPDPGLTTMSLVEIKAYFKAKVKDKEEEDGETNQAGE